MSIVIGTAQVRDTEDQRRTNGRLHSIGGEGEPPKAETSPVTSPRGLPLEDINRLERLLIQLEAHSTALVPYAAWHIPQIPPAQPGKAFLASAFIALWLSTLVSAVTWVRLTNHPQPTVEQLPVATPREVLIAPESRGNDAASIDHLASALAASSERLNRLEEAIKQRNKDLPRKEGVASLAPAMPLGSKLSSTGVSRSPSATPSSLVRSKNWDPLLDCKPTESAFAHTGNNGTIDYWVIPQGPFFHGPVRVVPIGRNTNGVWVRNLEDGRNYRLTPSGDWYFAVVPPAK